MLGGGARRACPPRPPRAAADDAEDVNGAEGVDYDLAGSGGADVYSRGGHIAARWDLTQGPPRLLGGDGRALSLPAGLTWMHLVDPDTQVTAGA